MEDLTGDPVQIDYSLLLHRHPGCPWLGGDLNDGGRAGGMEVLVVATTNKQVLCLLTILMHHIMTMNMI